MNDLTPVVDKILNQPAEKNIPYQELTGKIIGCAMKILNYYGPWYVEYVYQKGLEHLYVCLTEIYQKPYFSLCCFKITE